MDPLGPEIDLELARFGPQAGMAEVVERWPAVVGPAIARNAWPARIARDGTVHVHTADSVWAFELGQRSREIAAKLGAPQLRFAPGPLPEPDEAATEEAVQPTPEEEERARAIASAIGDEDLRERVQKAVCLGLARRRDDPLI
jgi:Dna[CI] antecedent DciA-like protein